jgi:glutamate-ammonia-ligase adenylyltransferase
MRGMRERLEASGSSRDVKRGFGGIIDVEFLVQMFRLKFGRALPQLRNPSTWATLDALLQARRLTGEEHGRLLAAYDFLRLVESRLRIVHNRSLDELPEKAEDLDKLARRLGIDPGDGASAGQRFLEELDRHMSQTRELFLQVFARERGCHE